MQGLVLFNFFINGLGIEAYSKISKFADNTKFFQVVKSENSNRDLQSSCLNSESTAGGSQDFLAALAYLPESHQSCKPSLLWLASSSGKWKYYCSLLSSTRETTCKPHTYFPGTFLVIGSVFWVFRILLLQYMNCCLNHGVFSAQLIFFGLDQPPATTPQALQKPASLFFFWACCCFLLWVHWVYMSLFPVPTMWLLCSAACDFSTLRWKHVEGSCFFQFQSAFIAY